MESATEPRGLPAVHRPARELDRREREILAFEGQWWKYAGAKEQAVRELFDMSPTRYYQVLNALIDKPEALAAEPLLILLRRFATESAREEARLFCDELMAEDAVAPLGHDLIAA